MTSTPNPHRSSRVPAAVLALAALLASLVGLLFASAPAWAVYSRPVLSPITGVSASEPFEKADGIAVDDESGDVYVGERDHEDVDEFNSAGTFVEQMTGPSPTGSLAFEDPSVANPAGHLYTAGHGTYVAVDNSTHVHYVTNELRSSGEVRSAVEALNAQEVPEPFEENGKVSYVRNNELIGVPCGESESGLCEFEGGEELSGIAVDSSGDIFLTVNHIEALGTSFEGSDVVVEFKSSGRFIGMFEPVEHTPAGYVGSSQAEVGSLIGVTVDPANKDLLIEVKGREPARDSAIDEFTSTGVFRTQFTGYRPSEPFVVFQGQSEPYVAFGGGIAVSAAGDLYADVTEYGSNTLSKVDVWGHGAFYPGAVTGGVSGQGVEENGKARATLNGVMRGALNSETGKDLELEGCDFEYVTEVGYKIGGFNGAALVPCVLESGSSPVGQRPEEKNYKVHADVGGLESGAVYRDRLVVATNKGEEGEMVEGEVESFAAAAKPAVEAVSVSDVSSSFAHFNARIDPLGVETTYQFEYVDAAGYEAALAQGAADPYAAGTSVPVPAGDIGAGDAYLSVSAQAGGLAPGTVYHYRVVASNGVGVTDGADATFSSVAAGLPGLPDGRAYELVTPTNKGDAEDMFGGVGLAGVTIDKDVGYASEDGDHFLLLSESALGPFAVSGSNAYVFSRTEDGWSFKSVDLPSLGVQSVQGLVFDPSNFSSVGVTDLLTSARGEVSLVGLAGEPGGPYATLASAPDTVSSGGQPFELVGASEDLSHVVLQGVDHKLEMCESSEDTLAEKLDHEAKGLYQWSAARGCLSLVDVQPSSRGGGLISRCGAALGLADNASLGTFGDTHGAVSAGGSQVVFTAPEPGVEGVDLNGAGCWNQGAPTVNAPQLYMRVNGETTVEVSEPDPKVHPPATYPAMYVGASENGSKVFFLTKTELTEEAKDLKLHDLELYEYDTEVPAGERLVRVSRGDLESGPVEGQVIDVPAVSADGSAVYFNAQAELTPGAHTGGLYRYDTETGQTAYVAQPQGYPGVDSGEGGGTDPYGRWYEDETRDAVAGLDLEAPYYTTRDGQFLLFGAYRYDAADGSVVCVMCNPNGSGPVPDASFVRSVPGNENPAGGPVRGMSENGEYVFFDTAVPLVSQATNGKLDVYEWRERKGSLSHEGTTSLISSGQSSSNDYFLGSSAYVTRGGETVEGGNIFFGTHSRLVPADKDEEGDLYDARICTAEEPCIPSAEGETAQCEGSTCQSPPPLPLAQAPATLTFASSGNVIPEPPPPPRKTVTKKVKCAKAKTLSHGKCAKQKTKKHKAKKDGKSTHGKGSH